jgi:hypothetical protein
MNYEELYLQAEKLKIKQLYGECNDYSIRKFIDSGLVKKFHDNFLKLHKINSLKDELTLD